jgi:hypothetical protein
VPFALRYWTARRPSQAIPNRRKFAMLAPEAPVVLLALLVAVYFWPASARPGRQRVLAFSLGTLVLALFWVSAYVGPIAMENPRGLGAAIDLFLRLTATAYLTTAGAVQGVRTWFLTEGRGGYRHWIAVAVGFVLVPALMIPFV